jgi:hypothetical protein
MCNDEKKTEKVGIWMGAQLLIELTKLANSEDLSLSAYIHRLLHRHVYGHGAAIRHDSEGPHRPESGR